MASEMNEKVAYVKNAPQERRHECHWPGCEKQVPPAKWGCTRHWFLLPKSLRDKIWTTYKPGQEITLTPSEAYLKVAREIQVWIKKREERLAYDDRTTNMDKR